MNVTMKRGLLAAILALNVTACATVQHGPMQRIAVDSEPQGVTVQTDDCGVASTRQTQTPGVVWVSRRADRCALTFTARGYEPQTVTLHRIIADEFFENVEAADVFCSGGDCISLDFLLVGALFAGTGFAVDAATGALFELEPDDVFVEMMSIDER